jgi:hypothetical protein
MFVKEKFKPAGAFDKMKVSLVAGGSEQILEMIGDVSVSLSASLKVLALAKKEKKEIACNDIPGA